MRTHRNPYRRRRRPADLPARCILCDGAKVAWYGFWTPSPDCQRQVFAPPGEDLVIAYGVCRRCSQLPRFPELAEDVILWDCARLARSPLAN
jgi:hypothetical protein